MKCFILKVACSNFWFISGVMFIEKMLHRLDRHRYIFHTYKYSICTSIAANIV